MAREKMDPIIKNILLVLARRLRRAKHMVRWEKSRSGATEASIQAYRAVENELHNTYISVKEVAFGLRKHVAPLQTTKCILAVIRAREAEEKDHA